MPKLPVEHLEAIKIEANNYSNWFYKGYTLCKLQEYEEAIACFDRALEIYPEHAVAWYNKACCYAEQNNVELAIENLKQVLVFDTTNLMQEAKTDSSFDLICEDSRFQEIVNTDIDSI